MTSKETCIKELRQLGVLSYNDFEKEVERYEPYTDRLENSDLMAYFISRAKIEVLSAAYMHMEDPISLKEHLTSNIEGNLNNINSIRTKLDKIIRN